MKANIRFLLLLLMHSVIYDMQAQVKMGIAGMTHDHVNAILQNPKNEGMILVGFAEPNKALAMKRLKQYKLSEDLWFPTLEELISKTNPDAICDFRSTLEHEETVRICAPLKIHVMVEKPLAVNLYAAKRMEALAVKNNIHLITNYETTWYPGHHKAYEMINNGAIGDITKVMIHDGHMGPKEIGCSTEFLDWLTDPVKNGGGAIMDFGCYGADIMSWLMKDQKPVSVTAVVQTNKPSVYPKVDDEATIIVQYPKAQGIFQASWNWPFDRKDTEVYGTRGYIFADKSLELRTRTGARNAKEEKLSLVQMSSPRNNAFTYFASVVTGDINPKGELGSLDVNMKAMVILDAAVKSAKTGKVIKL